MVTEESSKEYINKILKKLIISILIYTKNTNKKLKILL